MGYILVILLYLKVYARSKDKLDFPLTKSMTFAGDLRRAKEKNAAKLKTAAEEAQAEYLEANAKAERSEQFLGCLVVWDPWFHHQKRPQLMEKHRKNMGFTG